MTDERIYVIVPETVQVEIRPTGWRKFFYSSRNKSVDMVSGRLIAQGVHVGRILGHWFAKHNIPYRDITAIVLSVRNTKELRKVSDEALAIVHHMPHTVAYEEFHDTNEAFYGTTDSPHTITVFGPVDRETMEDVIGHLELYNR